MIDDRHLNATGRPKAEGIDTAAPNASRVADYLNSGRDNFAADRQAARAMIAAAPAMAAIVPAVLAFHQRAVRYLTIGAGIRQFIDVATGLPPVQGGVEIAEWVDPASRVVYVDSDPMVLSHVRAYSRSTSQGAFAAINAKLTDPAALIAGAAATLDFRQPVAVLLPSTLPFIPDTARVAAIVAALLRALSPGSYLGLCHVASDLDPALAAAADDWNRRSSLQVTLRSHDEVAALTAGLELVEPGLVPVNRWRAGSGAARADSQVPVYAVLARKPWTVARQRSGSHQGDRT
jgi:hypothetical protein